MSMDEFDFGNSKEREIPSSSSTDGAKAYTEGLDEDVEDCLRKTRAGNMDNKAFLKDAGMKLVLSTCLILMVLGVGLLNQKILLPKQQPETNRLAQTAALPQTQTIAPVASATTSAAPPAKEIPVLAPVVDTSAETTEPAQATEVGKAKALAIQEEPSHIDKGDSNDAVLANANLEAEPEAETRAKANASLQQDKPRKTLFVLPAKGKWSKAYGYAYDKTWQDYRFHGGVDMELPLNSKVKALGDGTVLAILKDPAQGEVLKLDHGNNLISIYYGLKATPGLEVNSKIAGGTLIGTVTASPLFESEEKPHLHLEVWQDGKKLDPQKQMQ